MLYLLADAPVRTAADLWQVRLQLDQLGPLPRARARGHAPGHAARAALCASCAAFFVSVSFLFLMSALGDQAAAAQQQQEREQQQHGGTCRPRRPSIFVLSGGWLQAERAVFFQGIGHFGTPNSIFFLACRRRSQGPGA